MYRPTMIKPEIRIADENSEYADLVNILRDKLLIAERERDQLFLALSRIASVIAVCKSRLYTPQRYAYAMSLAETRSDEELKAVEWIPSQKGVEGKPAFLKAQDVLWQRSLPHVSPRLLKSKLTRLTNKQVRLEREQAALQAKLKQAEQTCAELTNQIAKLIIQSAGRELLAKYAHISDDDIAASRSKALETPYKRVPGYSFHKFELNELEKVLLLRQPGMLESGRWC